MTGVQTCALPIYAVATTPAQRLGAYFALFPSRISLPRNGGRVGLRIVLFEACSAFTHVTACTLASSPIRDTLHQRLQPLCYLHSCSGCFRLERSPGGSLTHWESAALARRTPIAAILLRLGKISRAGIMRSAHSFSRLGFSATMTAILTADTGGV